MASTQDKTVYKTTGWCGFASGSNTAAVDVKDGKIARIRPVHFDEEYAEARQTLERLNWKVDYIITHCAPTTIQQKINPSFKSDKLTDFLEEIRCRSQFHYWLFGHYHDNRIIDEKCVMLYEQMVRIL